VSGRLLLAGSPNWRNTRVRATGELWDTTLQDVMVVALDAAWRELGKPLRPVLVHGACPTGADRMADELWRNLWGWPTEEHPADWEAHGKAGDPIRNQHMVSLGADLCVGFPLGESCGTYGCLALADAAEIPTRVYGPHGRIKDWQEGGPR
jgi:hypothetical protein